MISSDMGYLLEFEPWRGPAWPADRVARVRSVRQRGPARASLAAFRAWRSTLPGGLERDTLLMPEVIAEKVVREAEHWVQTELPAGFAQRLAARAHQLYACNRRFKKQLNRPGNAGRDLLSMYMRHWTAGWLSREYPALGVRLPEAFALGRRVSQESRPG